MEAIVLKVLKKYLKLFIKNFTPDNFSLSLLKGEGQLVDLHLNENVIQELLLIPPQLRVIQASCDTLTAKVPWTSYRKDPITMSMQTISIQLKEPEIVTALQPQFKKFKKKNKNKRNEVTENMQELRSYLQVSVSTSRGDSLILEVDDVLVQSTNSGFQPVDLTQIKTIDKEQGIESLHKLITAKSISIKIQDIGGMSYNVIENMPLKVLFSSKRRIKDWSQLSAKVEILMGFLNLNWTLTQWHLISDLFTSFQEILARAAPPPAAIAEPESKSSKKKKEKKEKKDKEDLKKEGSTLSPGSMNGSPLLGSSPSPIKRSTSPGDLEPLNNPASPSTEPDVPLPKHSDVTYDFHIDKWRLELVDSHTSDSNFDSGFQFQGDGLHFGFTSTNVNYKPTNEDGVVIYSLPIRESIVSVVMNSLQIQEIESFKSRKVKHELCGNNEESPRPAARKYDHSITSISSDGISERIQIHHYQGPYLMKGNFIFRKPIVTDENPDPLSKLVSTDGKPLPPLIGLELNLHLSHFMLYGDRRSWKKLISFLMPPEQDLETDSESDSSVIDPTSPSKSVDGSSSTLQEIDIGNGNGSVANVSAAENNETGGKVIDPAALKKKVVETGKKTISKFKRKFKLGSNWKNQIKIIVKATETLIFIPEDPNEERFKGSTMKLKLGSFVMRNHSEWKNVPHLYEGLQLIDSSAVPDPITLSGLDHRFSFKMENISCIINENSNSTDVLLPTTISLFLRASRSQFLLNEKRIPKIDLTFISSDFNFRITKDQSEYLDYIGKKYLSPDKMKALLQSRIKSIKSVAKKKLNTLKEKHIDRTLTIKKKVEKTLQQYHWSVYICIQKGVFFLPLQHLLEPKTMVGDIVDTTVTSDGSALSEFKVESMGLALVNNATGQNIVFKVGTFEATGIEHPKLTTSTTLRPLPVPEDEYIPSRQADNTNLLVAYRRRQKKDSTTAIAVDSELNDWIAEVNVRLQGTQVMVVKKKGSSSKKSGLKIPDIQNFITKLVNTIEQKKEDIDNLKKGIKKVKLDIVWSLELGNCEILMGNKSKGSDAYRPKGIVRITDTNRKTNAKAYKDIEEELLKKTLESAQSEEEKDYFNNKINQLTAELENIKKQSNQELLTLKQEYMTLESKFIQTKMTMAEMENENDSLKYEMKKLQKK
ncbi:hypothetical protein PPL_03890 [Heterostelium album PN500]|uniref:Chorein N-terminal domain-containing protein n=1 Tax=Heterostelium pallidum (strain ATCC 26659 / Pp 5 / PN500) TaxID=670386 RepID=D3B5F2_HETP5|nr:hypothetical protein PPL_03890 [Heterostelium album PN500]EFA83100.1 hypothetical protein PPL_03890 [Heterostelium album PN500]|eukprot:XP_020435217.1 hypothetical protein PPL_03890 [Heterostelium album PN500]